MKNFKLKVSSIGTFNKKHGRKENSSFRMVLAGAACILLFSNILSMMDYIPLECIMSIKMLGNKH